MTARDHWQSRVPSALRSSGFTLLELAVVVAVITLMIGSLLVPLTTQVNQRNVTETERRLEEARQALLGYAMAHGRFPCPASNASNGVESFAGGSSAVDGGCSDFFDGFVPAVTLGLNNLDANGYMVDGWGLQQNRIRYAISNATVPKVDQSPTTDCVALPANCLPNALTRNNGMQQVGMTNLAYTPPNPAPNVKHLYVCASTPTGANDCGAALPLADGTAAFMVYSLGKNASEPTSGAGADEAENLDNDRVFISKTASSAAGAEFDDIVVWTSVNTLISRLVAAGQLP